MIKLLILLYFFLHKAPKLLLTTTRAHLRFIQRLASYGRCIFSSLIFKWGQRAKCSIFDSLNVFYYCYYCYYYYVGFMNLCHVINLQGWCHKKCLIKNKLEKWTSSYHQLLIINRLLLLTCSIDGQEIFNLTKCTIPFWVNHPSDRKSEQTKRSQMT